MRRVFTLLLVVVAAFAHAQSVFYEFGEKPVGFQVAYSGVVPFTTFTGVAIVRTQADMDALWAAIQGKPGLKNAVSPIRLGNKDEQLIVVVAPREFEFDAQMMVGSLTDCNRLAWNLEIVPQPATYRNGLSGSNVVLIVRTKCGPDALDVSFRGPKGDVFAALRTRGRKPDRPIGLTNWALPSKLWLEKGGVSRNLGL
jgi:hypothetical protein